VLPKKDIMVGWRKKVSSMLTSFGALLRRKQKAILKTKKK
jgi:hypothetical protein